MLHGCLRYLSVIEVVNLSQFFSTMCMCILHVCTCFHIIVVCAVCVCVCVCACVYVCVCVYNELPASSAIFPSHYNDHMP